MNKFNDIRILQISDCHISSNLKQQWCDRYPQQTLSKIVNYINDHEPNKDAVIATGDLSHDSSKESYTVLSKYFSSIKKPVYALAGNHDDPEIMKLLLNKEKISTSSHFVYGNWLIIMLNTHAPKAEHGNLCEQQLALIETLLQQHQEKYILIAMHHPPITIDCAWIDKINLLNSQEFITRIARYKNIKAIVFGHVHQDTETTLNGIQYLSCPSTCHQYKPNSNEFAFDDIAPGYRWIDLQQDGNIKTGVIRISHHAP